MDLVDLGVSAASGGVLGLVGTALGRVAGIFEARQTHSQERERWAHERQMEEVHAQRLVDHEDRISESEALAAAYEGLQVSHQSDAAIGESYRWVQAVRSLVRPVLTPFLWIIYLVVFFAILNGNAARFLSSESQGEFIGYFIANIAFAASAATLWWFGDRALPPRQRQRN